jgi:uncharacterized repeat protein (TIGR03803 family)
MPKPEKVRDGQKKSRIPTFPFELPPASRFATARLYRSSDGASPFTFLIRDKAGNLYGATEAGDASGAGTVFKMNKSAAERCGRSRSSWNRKRVR